MYDSYVIFSVSVHKETGWNTVILVDFYIVYAFVL